MTVREGGGGSHDSTPRIRQEPRLLAGCHSSGFKERPDLRRGEGLPVPRLLALVPRTFTPLYRPSIRDKSFPPHCE